MSSERPVPLGSALIVLAALQACTAEPSGAPDGSDGGASPDAAVCTSETPVVAVPSRARVELRVRGAGWLVTTGTVCGAMGVTDASGEPLRLGLDDQCICECAPPREPTVERAARLSSAEPTSIDWDGRALATWGECVDCGASWPGTSPQLAQRAAPIPAAAGHYTVTLLVLDELPSACTDSGDGTASCTLPPRTAPTHPPAAHALCPGARAIEVEVDLPETGVVTVDVVVPAR